MMFLFSYYFNTSFNTYFLNAYLIRLGKLGLLPCSRMKVLNILPPSQTKRTVNRITPARPANGCQSGIVTGDARRSIISMGVNRGKSDKPVEKLLSGSCITGIIRNMGRIMGNMAGN